MKKIFVIILIICSLVNIAGAQNADINLLKKINLERNKSFDPAFKFITNTATPLSIASPIIIFSVGIIKKDCSLKQKGIYIGETLFGAAFITTAMKYSIRRDRPYVTYPFIENETPAVSPSFPSGHTSTAFATATSLSIAFPKWYVIAPSFLWATSVGYSRMHLGVHYPGDVLAGAIIGAGTAFLTYKINMWIRKRPGP